MESDSKPPRGIHGIQQQVGENLHAPAVNLAGTHNPSLWPSRNAAGMLADVSGSSGNTKLGAGIVLIERMTTWPTPRTPAGRWRLKMRCCCRRAAVKPSATV